MSAAGADLAEPCQEKASKVFTVKTRLIHYMLSWVYAAFSMLENCSTREISSKNVTS